MARKPNNAPPEEPKLSAQQIQSRIDRINGCIDDVDALDVSTVNKRYGDPQVETIEAAIKDALSSSFGHGTPTYDLFYRATSIDQGPHFLKMNSSPFGRGGYDDHAAEEAREARQYLTEGKRAPSLYCAKR